MVTVTDFGSAASLHWGLWAFAQLISTWLLSGLWQGHCSTSILLFSVILVSICCCDDHCPVVWPKFGLSFSCRTDDLTCDVLCYIKEFMVNSVIVRWPAPPPSSFGHPISLGAADWSSQGVFSLSCKNFLFTVQIHALWQSITHSRQACCFQGCCVCSWISPLYWLVCGCGAGSFQTVWHRDPVERT